MAYQGQAEKDRTLWNSQGWSKSRAAAQHCRAWYKADPLQAKQPRRDRTSGNEIRQFPLNMNMVKLGCDIHRDLARGMTEPGDLLAITTSIKRGDEFPNAAVVESLLNSIWTFSSGGPIQQEGLLSMNIYGACAYQISYEPWNTNLPYRLAIRLHRDPSMIFPVWDHTDGWNMLKCYIGYEIDQDIAELKYSIQPNGTGPFLYMEEWTQDTWEVRINGQVPTMRWNDSEFRLSGKNTWGFVPMFYIPHERTISMMGMDSITGTEELVMHINARAGNISDLVQATRAGMLTMTDVQTNSFAAVPITVEGNTIAYAINLGKTIPRPGAQPPELKAWPIVDIPPGLVGYPRELIDYWMMLSRIAPSAFGLDDTQSGRITGPAVQARMFTSMAHASTERINYTTGKTLIDRRLIQALLVLARDPMYATLKAQPIPELTDDDIWLDINQLWPPSLLLDKEKMLEGLLARLKEKGISIEEFLRALGVKDIEGERERILAWLTDVTAIETPAPLPGVMGNDPSTNPFTN